MGRNGTDTGGSPRADALSERDTDVLLIGAGQAGLGTSYWLARHGGGGVRTLVLDSAPIGQSWIQRWDSLTLFTPRRFSSLPGLRFPRGRGFPSRTEMADYLRDYAERFALPVETGVHVDRLSRTGSAFVARTSDGLVRARQVVVATGPFHDPRIPEAYRDLHPDVVQLHSSDYRRPADLPTDTVLVVGGGNSAAQLAVELADAGRSVTVASPRRPWYLPESILGVDLYWWIYLSGVLNADRDARVSRRVRERGDAVIGTQLRQLTRSGQVRLHPSRVVGADGRAVRLADGTEIAVESVLWCTGFRPDYSWVEIPGVTDDDGAPVHEAGASPVPGLHWMGLPWQTRLNSSIIDGIDRDARRTAKRIIAALS